MFLTAALSSCGKTEPKDASFLRIFKLAIVFITFTVKNIGACSMIVQFNHQCVHCSSACFAYSSCRWRKVRCLYWWFELVQSSAQPCQYLKENLTTRKGLVYMQQRIDGETSFVFLFCFSSLDSKAWGCIEGEHIYWPIAASNAPGTWFGGTNRANVYDNNSGEDVHQGKFARTQVTGISFKFKSKRDRHVPLCQCSSSLLNTQSMPDLSASLRLLISALVPQARDDEPLNGELLAHCQELLNR
jgi:hypothetical protein